MHRLRSRCISCVADKYARLYPSGDLISEETKLCYVRDVYRLIGDTPLTSCAPVIVRNINDLHERYFGYRMLFTDVKKHFNELMLSVEAFCWSRIASSGDPLLTAMKFSMLGNYIDFAAVSNVDEAYLKDCIDHVEEYSIPDAPYALMKQDLSHASSLVFLTDNCGEIVLDKLLIRQLKKSYPRLKVAVMVRGDEVTNDATMTDALQVGMTDEAYVIGNGSNVGGSWLPEFSSEAMDLLDQAGLIIAKGQGNFETLQGCGRNIYYLFLCKCSLFTDMFHVKPFTGMLVRDPDLERVE